MDILTRAIRKDEKNRAQDDVLYGNFMELFLESIEDYLKISAQLTEVESPEESNDLFFAASQRIYGDVDIVSCIFAEEPAFIRFASKFSDEEFDEVDDMVTDSVVEFLNVVNGIYSVQLASRKIETELAAPHWGRIESPSAEPRKVFKVSSEVIGDFYVALSPDEFIN